MAFAEINLRLIYVLLQSDWLAQNLELEPLNPGRSALTNFSFPLPANFRTRMHIRGKIRLARATSVRTCVCACVRVCVCVRNSVRSGCSLHSWPCRQGLLFACGFGISRGQHSTLLVTVFLVLISLPFSFPAILYSNHIFL